MFDPKELVRIILERSIAAIVISATVIAGAFLVFLAYFALRLGVATVRVLESCLKGSGL